MQKTIVTLPTPMLLVGITARTTNQDEMSPATAKIGPCIGRYYQEQIASKIPNRKRPGVTITAFTEYESDYTAPYTYFIGEEVTSIASTLLAGFSTLTVPPGTYLKHTPNPGPMPQVVIQTWQQIWQMMPANRNSTDEQGNIRTYQVDFEVYDERAHDPQNTVLDIYIGITQKG